MICYSIVEFMCIFSKTNEVNSDSDIQNLDPIMS